MSWGFTALWNGFAMDIDGGDDEFAQWGSWMDGKFTCTRWWARGSTARHIEALLGVWDSADGHVMPRHEDWGSATERNRTSFFFRNCEIYPWIVNVWILTFLPTYSPV